MKGFAKHARAAKPHIQGLATFANTPLDPRMMAVAQTQPVDLTARVKQRYKAIAPYDLVVVDSREQGLSNGRRLEFYPPDEAHNPRPGRLTVEVFDPQFQGRALEDMIAADFLHFLGKNDPTVIGLRNKFAESLTPEQREIDREAYRRAVAGEFGPKENRPFEQWLEQHRLDQYLGSTMLPPGPNREDWMRGMTPTQRSILQKIKQYLITGE